MHNQSQKVSAAVATALAAARGTLTYIDGTNSDLRMRKTVDGKTAHRVLKGAFTKDDYMTFDRATIDGSGAFLLGELERLDQRLHMPLAAVTWERDIDRREDVSMADEDSSFTNSMFSNPQGVAGSNKSWFGKTSNAVSSVGLDIRKTITPLNIWAEQLSWTLPELASAQKVGRPVDQQKYQGMLLKYDMDVDEQVYVGDTSLGYTGMLNQSGMTNVGNALNGSWANASPANILADINSLLTSVWNASAYANLIPAKLLLDPTSYGILVSTLISTAGNISIMEFVKQNSLRNASTGTPLDIQPCKWLLGTNNGNALGVAATNSMYAYTQNEMRIRFPIVPLQRTPLEYRDLRQLVTYFGRLGGVELVFPETTGLRSNLG